MKRSKAPHGKHRKASLPIRPQSPSRWDSIPVGLLAGAKRRNKMFRYPQATPDKSIVPFGYASQSYTAAQAN